MSAQSLTPETDREAAREARWTRFLGDLGRFAAVPQPLEMEGSLVRVTGLVLEAAGVRWTLEKDGDEAF